jgi:uncharacterized membrane protein YhhN
MKKTFAGCDRVFVRSRFSLALDTYAAPIWWKAVSCSHRRASGG